MGVVSISYTAFFGGGGPPGKFGGGGGGGGGGLDMPPGKFVLKSEDRYCKTVTIHTHLHTSKVSVVRTVVSAVTSGDRLPVPQGEEMGAIILV